MTKKTNSKQTKIKHRFGAFEVRISDDKMEIEDTIYKQRKFVYSNQTYEYGLFSYILSAGRVVDGEFSRWTVDEEKKNIEFAQYLVGVLNSTQLLFQSPELRNTMMEQVAKMIEKQKAPEEEEPEQEILDNLKAEYDAKEIIGEEIGSEVSGDESSADGQDE